MEFNHIPVLLNETIDNLNINPNGVYVDGTLGGGGHSFAILSKLTNGKLICIDQDINAINAGKRRLEPLNKNVIFVKDNFSNIKNILSDLDIEKIDGFLIDIGVSSHQLDEGDRGFSYNFDAPLDMRMNEELEFSAFDVVNNYTLDELNNVIFNYGEERWAKRIAQFIITEREISPIKTTFQLVDVIKKAIPKDVRKNGSHPAKKTFQAIRIEVNKELYVLEKAITDLPEFMNDLGMLCIITFHSLEDRIVKNCLRTLENPCECPREFPVCICKKKSVGKVVTRKPISPTDFEISENNRSRSAKLRVFKFRTLDVL